MRPLLLACLLLLGSTSLSRASWYVDGFTLNGKNGVRMQGVRMQGVRMQGVRMQGVRMQGVRMQGVRMQGISLQGVGAQGINLQGTDFTGTFVDAQPSSCSHSQLAQGAALPASCNKCAELVVSRDSYCGQYWWDGICVDEARSWCAFTSADLVGAEFDAELSDGTTVSLRLDEVRTVPDPTPVWSSYCDQSGCYMFNISANENADVKAYSFTVNVPERCNYYFACSGGSCGIYPYDCTPPESYSLCDSTDDDGLYNQAIPVAGQWNDCVGDSASGTYCGGKTPNTESTHFSLACRDVGALAKCVERFNYKPWRDPFDPVRAPLHQSCVRMVRADYCGDGQSHTYDNTWIDAYDSSGVQVSTSLWKHEALWFPYGAACVTQARYSGADPGGTHPTVGDYVMARCPGKFGIVPGGHIGDVSFQRSEWGDRAICVGGGGAPTLADPHYPAAFEIAYLGNRASTLGTLGPIIQSP